MNPTSRATRMAGLLFVGFGFAWACGFDGSLREYLSAHFWLPFAKSSRHFEKAHVRRADAPFAGMTAVQGNSPLAKLQSAYQQIAFPENAPFDPSEIRHIVDAARADRSLTPKQREEVDLIDAKIDLRAGAPEAPQLLLNARKKLEVFLRAARTPEFRSEARGWLARVHYLLGDQTAAGKIYLDELNRNGSNLSRETLLNSLQMNYRYDDGTELLAHLDEYFDTPEHAAFAIQLVTNPHWDRVRYSRRFVPASDASATYVRIKRLLERHANLLQSNSGSNALALLTMRVALRMGDPPTARAISESVPASATIRTEPDFLWMSASAYYLSRDFAAAEQPLLALFQSNRASKDHKAAAAYALCGVYQKAESVTEQLRYALWLHEQVVKAELYMSQESSLSDFTVYWAPSGWDLNILLESEASIETLQSFIDQNPDLPQIRLVKYSLAVRLTRENRYDEAAALFRSIKAIRRAPRIAQLASLYSAANRAGVTSEELFEARYKLAEFLIANSNGIYFNDALWAGFQRYALNAANDERLTRMEREALLANERKLKDDQEERWRAYLILRDVVRDAGPSSIGRKAARLALRSLAGISPHISPTTASKKPSPEA